jgi:hypothetical protein
MTTTETGDHVIDGQAFSIGRDGRRWVLIAERMHGQRTARFFYDRQTGDWYTAESWKRHNAPLMRELEAAFGVGRQPD